MRRFYEGKMPVLPGKETTFTYAHVDDVAEGHILAAEKGKIGESYILAGPAIPLDEMFSFWAHISGRPAPLLNVNSSLVKPFAPVLGSLSAVLPLSEMYSEESINMLGATYMARSDKARAKLGWRTRSLQEGMTETFAWIAQTSKAAPPAAARNQKIALVALAAAFVLLLWWLLGRRDEEE